MKTISAETIDLMNRTALLLGKGEMSAEGLKKSLCITKSKLNEIVTTMTFTYPIYEHTQGKICLYGLLRK